eukprot:EG_transcript_12215
MWSVLRRQQGEEYEPSNPTRGHLGENLNHIARFESKPNVKPTDPQMLPEPYESRVYQKLILNLRSPDLVLRQKAVAALIQLFGQKGEHVARTIEFGGIPALVESTKDASEGVRVDASIALAKLAAHPKGLTVILDGDLVGPLIAAVSDTPAAAVQALRTLQALDAHWNSHAGTAALLAAGGVQLYIRLAREGPDPVRAEALKALAKVYSVKEAFIGVLEAQVMPVLTDLLVSESPDVLESAAENVACLCFYSAGKRAAVQDPETTRRLLALITHEDTPVRVSATAALMGITIDNTGKELVIAHGGLEPLMACLPHETDPAVLVNVLKTFCNVSENPAARPRLAACVLQLHTIKGDPAASQLLVNTATRALEMITWKP